MNRRTTSVEPPRLGLARNDQRGRSWAVATAIGLVAGLLLAGAWSLRSRAQTLDEHLGLDQPDFVAAIEFGQVRIIERQTQTCMLQGGYHYQPVETVPHRPWYLSLSPIEYARLAGFGVVEATAPVLYSEDDPQVDPNREYVQLLASEDRLEYQRALALCMEDANDYVFGRLESAWRALQPAIQASKAELEGSPEYASALVDWRLCMESLNLGFELPSDVSVWIEEELKPKVILVSNGLVNEGQSTYDPSLSKLRELEVLVAVTYFGCTNSMSEALLSKRRSVEFEMISRNLGRVGRLKTIYDAYASNGF